MRVNIIDKENVFKLLDTLQSNDKPIFGIMTPQHMVEHLLFTVQISNRKISQKKYFSLETEQKIKAITIGSDAEIIAGFKAPFLPKDELLPLVYTSLNDAKENLKTELNDLDKYFLTHPTDKPIHPVMGELNYNEWIIFHNKHFTHHFKQFNLLQ